MAKIRIIFMVIVLLGAFSLALNISLAIETESSPPPIIQLTVQEVIGPATVSYLEKGFENAAKRGAALVVIRLDTPGGLDTSMRSIIQNVINSPIPVATYVAPSGARAASAGVYILYASHVAAMAPGTNVGAATPVQIGGEQDQEQQNGNGGTMKRKIINDAVAYIQSLAQLRGRNQEWAEKAVRESASLTAEQALDLDVVDFLASGIGDLMTQIDGMEVSLQGQTRTLKTTGLIIEEITPDWRDRLLSVITNPNIAYILMLIGIYGLIFEFSNPGAIVPGTVGAICLLLALYSFQLLPINYTGIGLILLGISLMVAEAFQPSFGVLGIGGLAAFVIGSIVLMDTEAPGFGINLSVILAFSIISGLVFIVAVGMAFKARHRKVVSGQEELIDGIATVIADFDTKGKVAIHSEIWNADTETPLHKGQKVRVTSIKGLTLKVEPVEEAKSATEIKS